MLGGLGKGGLLGGRAGRRRLGKGEGGCCGCLGFGLGETGLGEFGLRLGVGVVWYDGGFARWRCVGG